MRIVCTKQHTEDTYSCLETRDLTGYLAFPHDFIEDEKIKKCVLESRNDLLTIKRNYALPHRLASDSPYLYRLL